MTPHASSASYEMLVAYADGQLDAGERDYLLSLLDHDSELNHTAWELCKLKDAVALSYQDLPCGEPSLLPEPRIGFGGKASLPLLIVASVTLAVLAYIHV